MTDEQQVPLASPVRRASGLPTGDLLDTVTVTVDLAAPRVALAIGAHPDDIEFGAGATLAGWAASGCLVHHLVLTDGSKGSWNPNADLGRLVTARKQECRKAAALLYAGQADTDLRVRFLDKVDGELVNDVATRREVCRVIREVRPDVLLGHDPWRRYRLHPDHRTAGFLTLDALVAARDPHFFPELDIEPHRPTSLLLWEADLPNHVERSNLFEGAKVDALLCHSSQLESTMRVGDSGQTSSREAFAARIAWQLARHGAVAGIDAGEAFHRIDDL